MRSYVGKIATVLAILYMVLLAYVLVTNGEDVTKRRQIQGYQALEDYKFSTMEDMHTPLGFKEEYIFVFDGVDGSYRDLFFYTEHRKLDVYVGEERVYRLRSFINNSFGSTPGCAWNSISLEDCEAGETVRIVATPVYKSVVDEKPLFYYGDKYEIGMAVLKEQLPTLLLCLFGVLAGLFYVVYSLFNYRKYTLDMSLLMLGCLAVCISMWKMTDNVALYMLFPGVNGLYMAPLVFVHLGVIPFQLFVKELNGGKEEKIWYIPIVISLFSLAFILGLQLMEICDFRQVIWVVYLEWFVTAIVTFGMICYKVRRQGLDARRRRNLLLLLLCVAVMAADTGIVVLSSKSSFVGMLGFVAYILLMGIFSINDAKELMAIGIEARNFEKKAYQDQLTGLYNRTAYTDWTTREGFEPEKHIVVVFDLNNLKKYNDAYGHEAGDRYLKACAKLIQEAFGDVGKCYRMGGDEFSVLMQYVALEECKRRIRGLKAAVEAHNDKNPDMVMGIACGYEFFDKRLDHDINDTARRADKMMYREKYAMKRASNG